MIKQGPWGRLLKHEGAILEAIINALQSVDPIFALAAGAALGALITLAVVYWKPRVATKADPLSNLFAGDTLQNQIERVADDAARFERADRDASAIRAKLFARKAAQATQTSAPIPPHRAERYDHAAVLDHIAKVMRAGSEVEKEPKDDGIKDEGQFEEILLLPAPPSSSQKAA